MLDQTAIVGIDVLGKGNSLAFDKIPIVKIIGRKPACGGSLAAS